MDLYTFLICTNWFKRRLTLLGLKSISLSGTCFICNPPSPQENLELTLLFFLLALPKTWIHFIVNWINSIKNKEIHAVV